MFENKKILILGMARSGVSAADVLLKRNNTVLINDVKDKNFHDKKTIQELEKMGCQFVFGQHPDNLLDKSFDYLIKNPGIKDNHPYVLLAKKLGITVLNEVELAYLLLPKDIILIGITGTNGKTTSTTLTYNIMHEAFPDRVHLAGNIGYPLCSVLDKLKPHDIVVMEVSVQQSVNIHKFHPHISLMTNYSPAHIDFLDSYDNYKKTKAKMFYNQEKSDIAILNMNNQEVLDEMKDLICQKKFFSSTNPSSDCYLKDDAIYYHNEKVIDKDIIKIPGMHNIENILGAIAISKEFGVKNEVIKKVIENFTGVMHRLEFVREINGVRFYNDTEATNIKCTQIALSSFKEPIILILGGLERGQNFDDLIPFMKNVKAIIGIGEVRERVRLLGEKLNINTYIYEFMKDSFGKIDEIMKKGDVVLLSPASASWDQYKECEVRGMEFKKLVSDLENGKRS